MVSPIKVSSCCEVDHEVMNGSQGCGGGESADVDHVGRLPGIDQPRIERAVREILIAIGEDPDRKGLLDTPLRVARAYAQLFGGLHQHAGTHLSRVFEQEGPGEVVICRGIEFHSMCEHHLLPFSGMVHVAYVPNGRDIVGLSKLARTVDVFARRPQVQERLTNQIADAIEEHLQAAGVLVVISSEHLCMKMRGVSKQQASMVTTAGRGTLCQGGASRSEVMSLLMGSGVS